MTRIRNVGRWLANWRNLLGIAAIIMAATLSGEVVVAENARIDLAHSLQAQINAEAASNRQAAEIASLEAQAAIDGARTAQLLTEVAALDSQVAALGARPVVVDTKNGSGNASTASTPKHAAAPSTPTTTTTTRPPSHKSTPPPKKCGGVKVLGVCAG